MNHTPFYARLTAVISRPLVLIAALVISMPAEIQLARSSGFSDGFEYLMPLVLSLYSAASAVIAATRPRGTKGRTSAIVGSGVALGMALSAQVVGHLISSGYMTSGPVLVSLVSSVPALAACHMLHLAALPKSTVGVNDKESGHESKEEPVNGSEATEEETKVPAPLLLPAKSSKGRSKPPLAAIREAAQNLDVTGQLVTGPAIAKALGVSDRTGARYIKMLTA